MITFNAEKFALAVTQARADTGLTYKALAAKAGLSHNGIWYIENRRGQKPFVDAVLKLCDALGLKIEDFVEEEEKCHELTS